MGRTDNLDIRQDSFVTGEIAPIMYQKPGFKKYKTALRKCSNWIVSQHGSLVNRPGTKWIAAVKDAGQKVRLVPFIFSNDVAIVMEFGVGYVRFYQNGAQILAGGVPVEVVTPYGAADLFRLKFAQSGDVVTITRWGYEPRDLRRLTAASTLWDLIPSVTVTLPAPPLAAWISNYPDFQAILDNDGVTACGTAIAAWASVAAHDLEYAITAVYVNARGVASESLPIVVPVGPATRDLAKPALKIVPDPANQPAYFNVYCGRAGYYGFLDAVDAPRPNPIQASSLSGSVISTSAAGLTAPREYVDTGELPPDYSVQPPTWTYPFTKPTEEWAPWTYFGPGDRVYVNGSTYEVQTPGCSGVVAPGVPAGTVRDGADDRKPSTVYHVGDHICLNGCTWICVVGGTSSAASPALNVNALKQGTDGSITWQLVQSAGSIVWRFVQVGQAPAEYPGVITYFDQRKLFACFPTDPTKIVGSQTGNYQSFDVQPVPLETDGVKFSLAAQRYEEIRSFIQLRMVLALTSERDWTIAGGTGGAIAPNSILARPNNVRGASWLDPLLIGTTGLYVQALGTQVWELVFDFYTQGYLGNDQTILAQHLLHGHQIVDWAYAPVPYSVVWAAREDGKLLGFTYLREQEVAAWHQHDTDGAVESLCAAPETIGGVAETGVYLAVRRTLGDGSTVRYVERFASRYVPDATQGVFLDCAVVKTGTAISGLDHLEGKAVTVLADGMPAGPYTVLHGAIDISDDFPDAPATVIVGLPYVSDAELLDLLIEDKNVRPNTKDVYRASVDVVDTRSIKVGADASSLMAPPSRKVEDDYTVPPQRSALIQVRIASRYETNGRILIRQDQPLPATIVGASREVSLGGN